MFYDRQPVLQQQQYKEMLSIVGSLSRLFSASDEPMLYYRAHENIFCKYFQADNLSREDCSADASKGTVGVGLKTWVGRDDQKVAEFGRLRPQYEHLTGMDLIRAIAEYRNVRIRTTMNLHGLNEMIYHIVKRVPNAMKIYECAFDYIDTDNLTIDANRGNANNTYFNDGHHTYHFSTSKNTLYMIFDDMELMDSFDVEIENDPYDVLRRLLPYYQGFQQMGMVAEQPAQYGTPDVQPNVPRYPQLCLRLYNTKADGTKFVPEKSGLNQWNAGGRERDDDELYIAYLVDDRARDANFFPPRDTSFNLTLPDGTEMTAKVCQRAYKKVKQEDYDRMSPEDQAKEDARALVGKSIMSNPNKVLGKWLLRDVFNVDRGTLVTYDMLRQFGVDSVLFTKLSDSDYTVDFAPLGTYERMYDIHDIDADFDDINED